jgi:hypothetical protein
MEVGDWQLGFGNEELTFIQGKNLCFLFALYVLI